jgi:hypothetical protein
MNAVYALYTEPADVQRAVDNLRAAGVADGEITVISSEPIEEFEFSHRHEATWLHWIAGCGGAAGLLVGVLLTAGTELAWPLSTGNMPIVAWWPNLIVIFELTMLGAILATVITLFITAKIPSREPRMYDPAVSDGKILVGVEKPAADFIPVLERALLAGGTGELRRT